MKNKIIVMIILSCLIECMSLTSFGKSSTTFNAPRRSRFDISDFRFGGGVGYGLYVTNQMDYTITRNFGDYKELIPTYFLSVNKQINDDIEVGLEYRHGHLMTLKSENTQGAYCDFNDAYAMVNYSFNHNVGLTESNFTFNLQMGLGATSFRSKYFLTNIITESEDKVVSSVGYEGQINSGKDIKAKPTAMIGSLGFNMGYRLNRSVCLYWSNTINVSTTNQMTGNLFKRSWLPPDSYFYSSVGVYFNLSGGKRGYLGCPRF